MIFQFFYDNTDCWLSHIEVFGSFRYTFFDFVLLFMNLILLIVMLVMGTKVKRNGYALCLYLIGYGLIRFVMEGLRADSLYIIPGIRVSQVLALCLIPLGIVMWLYISKKGEKR